MTKLEEEDILRDPGLGLGTGYSSYETLGWLPLRNGWMHFFYIIWRLGWRNFYFVVFCFWSKNVERRNIIDMVKSHNTPPLNANLDIAQLVIASVLCPTLFSKRGRLNLLSSTSAAGVRNREGGWSWAGKQQATLYSKVERWTVYSYITGFPPRSGQLDENQLSRRVSESL